MITIEELPEPPEGLSWRSAGMQCWFRIEGDTILWVCKHSGTVGARRDGFGEIQLYGPKEARRHGLEPPTLHGAIFGACKTVGGALWDWAQVRMEAEHEG